MQPPESTTGFAHAPTIKTERVLLDHHHPEDWEESAAMWADPDVVRHIGGRASSREESWARLLRYAGMWPLLGFGYWCLRERRTGRFVGELGFADFKRDISPALGDAPEAGWALASWAHGQGFAREALTAALSWADANIGQRTVCMIDDGNVASINLARSCGYLPVQPASYRQTPTRIYARVGEGPRGA